MKSIFTKKSKLFFSFFLICGLLAISPYFIDTSKVSTITARPLTGGEPFRLIDQASIAHAFVNYKNKKSLFFTYVNHNCINSGTEKFLSELPQKPESSSLLITDDSSANRDMYQHFTTPVLFDDLGFVIRAYNFKAVGDFVEVSPLNGEILSTGSIASKNKCLRKKEKIPPDFQDVKIAFAEQCLRCHMQKEGLDYFANAKNIQKWSKMMMKTMETYRMPPGGFDTTLKYKLKGMLDRQELRPIYDWLAAGAHLTKKDEQSLLQLRQDMIENSEIFKFRNRKPDLVLKSKRVDRIPAQGENFEVYFGIGKPTTEDAYYEAALYSYNEKVLHHSMLYKADWETLNKLGSTRMFQAEKSKEDKIDAFINGKKVEGLSGKLDLVFGYSNNKNGKYVVLSHNSAQFVPKGTKFILNNHYFPWGDEEKNSSKILLFKYTGKTPPVVLKQKMFMVRNFVIQPGESDFHVHTVYPIVKDMNLHSVRVHLHMRGRDIKVYIKRLTGEKELILSVPFYLYKHNMPIDFLNPIAVEKGAELHFHVKYDNSDLNPANPDPTQKLNEGLNLLNNEMYLLILKYSDPR